MTNRYEKKLIEIASTWIVGTTLDGASIEVLNYLEDGVWTVAIDFCGRPCDEEACGRVIDGMRGLGLQDVERVEDAAIRWQDGLRVYSNSGDKSLKEILSTKEAHMDEFYSKTKCDRCGAEFGDGLLTLSRFNKQVICSACSQSERQRPDYDTAVKTELEEIKKRQPRI